MTRTVLFALSVTSIVTGVLAMAAPPSDAVPAKVIQRKPIVPEAAKPVYDDEADAKQQIAGALANAKREHRRVLIQWGGNWCPWCIRLNDLMTSDKDIARTIKYEYDLIHVDCGRPSGKNMDLAASHGAGGMKTEGFPYLTVLDEDGKPVVNRGTGSLELGVAEGREPSLEAGHDPKAVLKFLTDHQAPVQTAAALLDEAKARSKAEDKSVFVHFGAPWCGWCHRLEDWMHKPENAAILAKDFVDLKIDTDRFTGGQDMLDGFRSGKSGGIPWFVILNSKGEPIANGNAAGGNIGFPTEEADFAHLRSMLEKARKRMIDADIAALIDSLKTGKASAGAH